eukprot:Colp12_sorted_trinity150504_noHs@23833
MRIYLLGRLGLLVNRRVAIGGARLLGLLLLLFLLLLVTAGGLLLHVLFLLDLLLLLLLRGGTSGSGSGGALQGQIVRGGLVVLASVLVQLALLDEALLALRDGPQAPAARVGVALHDHALDLAHHAVVDGGHHRGGHLGNAHRHGLALGGDHHDLVAGLDAVSEAQQTGDHELGAVADRVDRAVLDHHALEGSEQHLKGHHDAAQVALVLALVVGVLRVQHVVHGAQVLLLRQDARAHAAQLLHVASGAREQTQVHAQRTDVGAGLAGHPEHAQVAGGVVLEHLGLVDRADAQLALHGRDERRALEQSSGEGVHGLVQLAGVLQGTVESHDTDVLLTGALLGLHQAGGAVNADDQAASHLGIQSATVAGLLHSHDALDPRNHLVTTRVGGLVEV